MNPNVIVSKSTKLGVVTRTFKKSIEEFSAELDSEIKDIRYAVESNRGWEGELYDSFHNKISAELKELEKLSQRSMTIAYNLERKAVGYDKIIDKLKNAGKT